MLLVKNAEVYAPEYLGKKDVLICGGKIEKIQDEIGSLPVECEVLDAEGKMLTPGFIDQHVHITAVGSSRIRMLAPRYSALMISTRCASPTEMLATFLFS